MILSDNDLGKPAKRRIAGSRSNQANLRIYFEKAALSRHFFAGYFLRFPFARKYFRFIFAVSYDKPLKFQ